MRNTTNLTGGGLELQMLPSHPASSNGGPPSKRKPLEDGDIFTKVTKKGKTEHVFGLGSGSTRKEENFGGLVIMRGPVSRPPPTQRQASSQPRGESAEHNRAGPSHSSQPPPSRAASKSTLDAHPRKTGNAHAHQNATTSRMAKEGDGDVEEAVKQMNTEADDLRHRSRASVANMTPAAHRVDFRFPASSSSGESFRNEQLGRKQQATRDVTMQISEHDTPQIDRNRRMRNRDPLPSHLTDKNTSSSDSGHSRRRSSISMRGKRVSATLESSGLITRPHTSVSDKSLYKHIDPDLPESDRVRQLLIWAGTRVMDVSSSRPGARRKSVSKLPDPPLPPLPAEVSNVLREAQEALIRRLVERKVNTNAFGLPGGEGIPSWELKENTQNVLNRAREQLFSGQIEQRRSEIKAWEEVEAYYRGHRDRTLASISQQRARTPLSAKAVGKQRATSQDPEDLDPWEKELPPKFRGPDGHDLAKHFIEQGVEKVGVGDLSHDDLRYKEDRIFAAISVARNLVEISANDLGKRFNLLSTSLAQRSLPSSDISLGNPSSLSNFIPVPALPASRNQGPDPLDLLRAISRTEASRPRSDAARRAAKDVQRMNETRIAGDGKGLMERKLTDVPPPTPRKPPGTPKRSNTPSAGRRG